MKVWITKYALSKGLFQINAEVDGKYAHGPHDDYKIFTDEWAKTHEEAVQIADAMRIRRIAALEKQIKKLKTLKF